MGTKAWKMNNQGEVTQISDVTKQIVLENKESFSKKHKISSFKYESVFFSFLHAYCYFW